MRRIRDNRLLFNMYSIYTYLVYIPVFSISTTFCGLGGAMLSVIFNEKTGNMLPVLWGRINTWAIPMCVIVEGRNNVVKKQSYIVIANHMSHTDTFLIYGWLPVDIRWVIKSQLRKVPV
jgi:1-acyl-sn-glycerol-3-phosphate acyltransferase